jgi:hypothetical protein
VGYVPKKKLQLHLFRNKLLICLEACHISFIHIILQLDAESSKIQKHKDIMDL